MRNTTGSRYLWLAGVAALLALAAARRFLLRGNTQSEPVSPPAYSSRDLMSEDVAPDGTALERYAG